MVDDWNWYDEWCGVIGGVVGAALMLLAEMIPSPPGYAGDVLFMLSAKMPLLGVALGYVLALVGVVVIVWMGIKSPRW